MSETVLPPPASPGIEPVDLRDALESRYLAYALSTITARALPDVRDGLKPVHRRVLYAMRVLRLDPGTGFKKSARVVGDVIGKFHPHGDQSVYDALVRLAQDFAQRFPLVDGQGNFGNIDGDNAAAMRYTEARLTAVAAHLLDGIDEDAVDFRDTYDGEESEPIVLPADFPNLLANGSSGIAVGMATSIPPHNVEELCDAALHLIAHPQADAEALMQFVTGPDFPTGGVLIEPRAGVLEAYRTGRGGFRLRAAWRVEEGARGIWQAVITEIPYQVQKSRLIEKIAELLEAKKLPLVGDIRDESAEDVRLVIEPRARTVDPAMMMEQLFRLTELEVRFPLNMNVLSQGRVPKVMGLPQALTEWLAHRRDVLLRRAAHRLAKIAARLEVLGGYLVAYLNLDEVIRIIRNSDEPKPELIAAFALSDVQAEAILNMRLRALRKLEEMEIRRERDGLEAEQAKLMRLTASEGEQWSEIGEQIGRLKAEFGKSTPLGRRRTAFAEAPTLAAQALETSFVEREPVTVVLSREGWLRAVKGYGIDAEKLAFKAGDALAALIPAQTTDKLIVFAGDGRAYTLEIAGLPGGRGLGEPLRLMVDMADGAGIIAALVHRPGASLLLASQRGNGFIAPEDEIVAQTRKGRQVMLPGAGDELAKVVSTKGDTLAVLGQNRRLLVFPLAEVPRMARGKGVRLQKYKDGGLEEVRAFVLAEGLRLKSGSKTQAIEPLDAYRSARAAAGMPLPKGTYSGGFAE